MIEWKIGCVVVRGQWVSRRREDFLDDSLCKGLLRGYYVLLFMDTILWSFSVVFEKEVATEIGLE